MAIKSSFISTYVCDRCGHKWVGKKINTIEGLSFKENKKFQEEFKECQGNWDKWQELYKKYNLKKPKICPKCKSKKWDDNKIIGKMDMDMIKVIEKSRGKEAAKVCRCRIDKEFHKKIVLEDIDKLKKELENYRARMKQTAEAIKYGELYLKDLEKELKGIENKK